MEYRKHDTIYAVIPELLIEKIVLDDQTFVVDNYVTKEGIVPPFCQVGKWGG